MVHQQCEELPGDPRHYTRASPPRPAMRTPPGSAEAEVLRFEDQVADETQDP